MRCSACGAENRTGARFCNGCGAALAATCASCGQGNPPGSRFCNECGQALTAPTRSSEPAPTPPASSPHSYTPRHLAEKILAGRDALAGERKQVTVLFADVVGSTELIRNRDPEDAQRLLDGAVQRMMRAVHRYEGTVSRLMCDGLMALFEATIPDHRAAYVE
jgi:class 3 adenylate cyclase